MRKPFILSIIIPIIVHGFFDCFIYLSNKNTIILSVLIIIYLYYFCFNKILKISKDDKKIVAKS